MQTPSIFMHAYITPKKKNSPYKVIFSIAIFCIMSDESHSEKKNSASFEAEHTAEFTKSIGVQRVEALSKQYSGFWAKVVLIFCVFLVGYAYGLDGTIRYTFQALATSSYSMHSLLTTVNVIRSVVSAVGQIAFARLSDSFGRMELFIVSILFYVVGTIIMSQAYDVERYAGGSVIYQVGYTGAMIICQVILADMSTLNWRVLFSFTTALPFIINTWISGNITDAVGMRWSWGIGMWAFIFPLACIPLLGAMCHMWFLAYKNGDLAKIPKTRSSSFGEKLKNFFVHTVFWQLDLVGLIFIGLTLGLILVPLTLAGGVAEQWRTGKTIAPLVVGGVVAFPFFVFWEIKYARHPIIPLHLLKDRAVWAALVIGIFINFVWTMQGSFLYTVLVVAVNQSTGSATRITSLYSFVSVITGCLLGFVIAGMRRLKPFIIFGTCMWSVSFGLLVYYRGDSGAYAGIIGAQCLLGFGAGFFTYPVQASIQTLTNHEHMAIVISLYLASYYVGSAIGSAISGAVWTQVLPSELAKRLSPDLVTLAYGSPFDFIIPYTWDTVERQAVVVSYRYVQKILCIVGLVLTFPLIGMSLFLKDKRLESVQSFEENKAEESSA